MAKVFDLYAKMRLDLKDFNTSLTTAGSKVGSFTRGLEKDLKSAKGHFSSLAKNMTMISAVPTASILYGFHKFKESAEQVNDWSIQLGMGTRALSELKYAAGLSGISMEELTGALTKQQKALAGNGDPFKAIGLDPENLRRMKPDEAFTAIIDALARVADQNKRTAAAMEIFGNSGAVMNRIAKGGSSELNKLREEARLLRLSLDPETTAAADDLGENIDRLKARMKGLNDGMQRSLLPTFSALVEKGNEFSQKLIEMQGEHRGTAETIYKTAAAVSFFTSGLGAALVGVSSQVQGLASILAILKEMKALGPIAPFIGTMGALAVPATAGVLAGDSMRKEFTQPGGWRPSWMNPLDYLKAPFYAAHLATNRVADITMGSIYGVDPRTNEGSIRQQGQLGARSLELMEAGRVRSTLTERERNAYRVEKLLERIAGSNERMAATPASGERVQPLGL
jgi:hypothetical protein